MVSVVSLAGRRGSRPFHEDEINQFIRRDAGRGEIYRVSDVQVRQGKLQSSDGAELKPTRSATTVRVRNGKTLTTDGPFAETKEQLGGYYLIEVPDLDQAVHWAARCPAAGGGSIEVRPLGLTPQVQ